MRCLATRLLLPCARASSSSTLVSFRCNADVRFLSALVCGISAAVLLVAAPAEAGLVEVVNQVSVASYRNYLDNQLYTRLGDNRGSGSEHDLARENIFDLFTSFGLSVSRHAFTYDGSTYYNIVGTKLGTTRPSERYIIGAHYDSVNNPGADDNASGVAGMLEAARVLADESLEASVSFIAFDREEQGLVGSWAYALEHQADDIRGMLSLDMIAYNPASAANRAYVYWSQDNTQITQDLAGAIERYSNGIVPTIAQLSYDASDHAPFDRTGKNAALLIEYGVWSNPYYHSTLDSVDTLGYIDYDYATNMTRGVVGYLAEQTMTAVPEPSPLALLLVAMPPTALFVRRGVRRTRHEETDLRTAV